MRCPYWEILLSGDRGAGKTDAILMKFAVHTGKGYGPAWTGVIFRQSYPELDNLIQKAYRFFHLFYPEPIAKYNTNDHVWTFQSGERLMFRFGRRPEDYWHHHGNEYPFIGLEELSQWPNDLFYKAIKSCSRSSQSGMPRYVISTTNPWGPGRPWIKKRFIDPAPAMHAIKETFTFDDGHTETLKRINIPVRLRENRPFLDKDPLYPAKIKDATFGDKEKEAAWLNYDWNVNIGAFFTDIWENDKHVIKWADMFWPPKKWSCYRAFDWGSASPFAVQWWTISDGTEAPNGKYYPRGSLILFDQWYGNDKTKDDTNIGLKMSNQEISEGIHERENAMEKDYGIKIKPGPADPSIFKSDGGPSIHDQMGGDLFETVDNSRISGWQKMREMMIGGDGGPKLYSMERCRDFIRNINEVLRSERNPDDVNTDMEDHDADCGRYMCMFDPDRYSAETFSQYKIFGY